MRKIKLPTDRTVFSTDNNGYAGKERDETLVDQNLWDSEIAADDRIPDGIGEIGEDDRPVYDEGFKIFSSAVFIRNPFAVLTSVIEIKH